MCLKSDKADSYYHIGGVDGQGQDSTPHHGFDRQRDA